MLQPSRLRRVPADWYLIHPHESARHSPERSLPRARSSRGPGGVQTPSKRVAPHFPLVYSEGFRIPHHSERRSPRGRRRNLQGQRKPTSGRLENSSP